MKKTTGYLIKSMSVVLIIAVTTLLLSATTKTNRKNAASSKGDDRLKTVAKKKLPMKSCSADFIIENGSSSTEITSFSLTANVNGGVPSTYNGNFSIYPSGSFTVLNSVHIFVGGSWGTTVTLNWDVPRGGVIILNDLDTGDPLGKLIIPFNSTTYTFTHDPLSCHGFRIRFAPLE